MAKARYYLRIGSTKVRITCRPLHIGSDSCSAQIVLPKGDDDTGVSTLHALVRLVKGEPRVRVISDRGIRVNRDRLIRSCELAEGDVLHIGGHRLEVLSEPDGGPKDPLFVAQVLEEVAAIQLDPLPFELGGVILGWPEPSARLEKIEGVPTLLLSVPAQVNDAPKQPGDQVKIEDETDVVIQGVAVVFREVDPLKQGQRSLPGLSSLTLRWNHDGAALEVEGPLGQNRRFVRLTEQGAALMQLLIENPLVGVTDREIEERIRPKRGSRESTVNPALLCCRFRKALLPLDAPGLILRERGGRTRLCVPHGVRLSIVR